MTAPFPGHGGPGKRGPVSLRASHCRDCAAWCRRDDPCACCLAVMGDEQVSELLDVAELAKAIYREVDELRKGMRYDSPAEHLLLGFDPRPLAVRLWREGWRKR